MFRDVFAARSIMRVHDVLQRYSTVSEEQREACTNLSRSGFVVARAFIVLLIELKASVKPTRFSSAVSMNVFKAKDRFEGVDFALTLSYTRSKIRSANDRLQHLCSYR